MAGLIQLVWMAARGPWHRGFFAAVVVAALVALFAPSIGWSGGLGLAAAFVLVVVAAFVAGRVPRELATLLLRKGVALSTAGRYDEAIAVFESYPQKFGEDHLHGGRVALSIELKAATLARSGRPSEALRVFDQVLRMYPDTHDAKSATRVSRILVREANALVQLGRPAEAAAVMKELVERFAESRYSAVRKSVASAQLELATLSGSTNSTNASESAPTPI